MPTHPAARLGLLAVPLVALLLALAYLPTVAPGPTVPRGSLAPAYTCPVVGNMTGSGTWVAANVTSGPAPLAVALCANANGSSANYLWFFGDGSNASGPNVDHTFVSPGAYDVRVQVFGAGVNDTMFLWIYATGGPSVPLGVTVSATPSNTVGDLGAQVSVGVSNARGPCALNWSVSNGTYATNLTPLPTGGGCSDAFFAPVPSAGDWSVVVLATDPLGDTGNGSARVAISPGNLTIAAVGASATSGPAPLTTTFFVNFTGADGNVSAFWVFGDGGNGTGFVIAHTYRVPGTYDPFVRLVDASGANATASLTITVTNSTGNSSLIDLALAPVAYTGAVPFTVVLDGNVTGGVAPYRVSVDWGDNSTFANGTYAGPALTFTHTYATAGRFEVVASASDSSDESTIVSFPIVAVRSSPMSAVGEFAATVGPGPVAAAAEVNVTGGTAPYTIQFQWGDGTVSSAANGGLAVHLYATVGLYHPYANVTDASGQSLRVGLGTVNVTAENGTTSASPGGGGLVPSGAGGWQMVGVAAAIGVAVGAAAAMGLALTTRARTVRKEGEGIAQALEHRAVEPVEGEDAPGPVKPS